jgi:ABC-type Fe3+ transport system substrate-binding protein
MLRRDLESFVSSRPSLIVAILATAACCIPAAQAQVPDAGKWAEIQKLAQAEGELNVTGPPSPPLRAALSAAFKARHGINLNYIGETTGVVMARIDTEFKVGRLSIDAHIGGLSTCWVFASRGLVKDINGKLVDPVMLDPSGWQAGKIRLDEMTAATGPNDPKCAFQFTEWVFTLLFANTALVNPPITSWNDLLKPQFKNRIAAFEPRSPGPGEVPVAYLDNIMSHQYTKDLYVGQNVRLSADSRQLAERVARGEYVLGMGLVPFAVEIYRRQGLPIAAVSPKEGGGPLTGGFGTIMLLNNTPHPNAAQVFANWIGTREAQTIYETNMMETSLRADVDTGNAVPDYVRRQKGVQYPIDDYVYSYYVGKRAEALAWLKSELPR